MQKGYVMSGDPVVEIIEPTKFLRGSGNTVIKAKRKVAAYARVSTEQDEQLTSYGNQIEYYTNYIKSRSDWEFVEVYSDEGISGLSTKRRTGFNRMIEIALSGGIDLILTKSVSRFARNTLDTLETVRKLKDNGVEVYFEKENIYTLDNKGELFLTIMATLAQEESRSISENVTWGKRRLMAQGKFSLPYAHFLGYKRGADGKPQIVEEQAQIVRQIFDMYIKGKSLRDIARTLMRMGIPTPYGKNCNWHNTTVLHILQNEKYKGSAVLQKTFTRDFLTKKRSVNNGEVRQFSIRKSHPAIIEPDVFDFVQEEITRRKGKEKGRHSDSPFDRKVICGECGNHCARRLWCTTSKGKVYAWGCSHRSENQKHSHAPNIREEDIQAAVLIAESRTGKVENNLINDSTTDIIKNVVIEANGDILICFTDGIQELVKRTDE